MRPAFFQPKSNRPRWRREMTRGRHLAASLHAGWSGWVRRFTGGFAPCAAAFALAGRATGTTVRASELCPLPDGNSRCRKPRTCDQNSGQNRDQARVRNALRVCRKIRGSKPVGVDQRGGGPVGGFFKARLSDSLWQMRPSSRQYKNLNNP